VRIATWNVNSLRARLEKLRWWLERAAPDVLLLQETKLANTEAPAELFAELGYSLAHHGEGRWNGVAIASRQPIDDVVVGFGDGEPGEARMIGARTAGLRIVCLYAPNGRTVGSTFYETKLAWFARLARWLEESARPAEPLVLGGDLNVAPDDRDVWDAAACHGGTHVSPPEREAFQKLLSWGLVDAYRAKHQEGERYTWWDYRAGDFYKNYGMRIDHLLMTPVVAERIAFSEIDREARKGKPIPSDHAPLVVDLDEPGRPFDAGWAGAAARIAQRRANKR
jgi:exodeoxyribonuclease III